MNDYDKAGRYLIKRDPRGFFGWLLGLEKNAFYAWIDARRHALPDQGDLTNDLVAAFRGADGFEALCVELQAESVPGSASRLLLGYVPRLLSEPAAPGSLPLTAVGGAVINLTGPPQPVHVEQRPSFSQECWLTGAILQRTLRQLDASATVQEIGSETISRWLLAWLPLMQGGANRSIIDTWQREAARTPHERDRHILAGLTLTFSDLMGCRAEWERGLEGWAVIKSPYLEELREAVRLEAKAEGRMEALRAGVLRLGRQRFGRAASRKQRAELEALTEQSRMERIHDRILSASSWADLMATP